METKTVEKVCGHVHVRETLKRIAALSVHPQSFLFSGPQHVGKSLVAREFAQQLIDKPFSSVESCPDLHVIGDRGEEGEQLSLSVEAIREAQQFLSRFPEGGKYRVVIIEHAERLTSSAENALLKILEEPNSSSVIILVTSRPGKLLPTVRSRLFPIHFSLVAPETVQQFFPEARELPDFFFTLGLPGLIHMTMGSPELFAAMKEQLRQLFQLSRLSWSERIRLAERLAESADELEQLLSIWLIGLSRRGSGARTLAEATFLEAVIETIDRIVERQGNPRLLLEKLFTVV